MARGKLEADEESRFVTLCEDAGYKCLKLKLEGRRGWLDRTVLRTDGVLAVIELKKPGRKGGASYQQAEWLAWLQANGFHAGLFNDADEAFAYVESLPNDANRTTKATSARLAGRGRVTE
jgi:hypothetical protein